MKFIKEIIIPVPIDSKKFKLITSKTLFLCKSLFIKYATRKIDIAFPRYADIMLALKKGENKTGLQMKKTMFFLIIPLSE